MKNTELVEILLPPDFSKSGVIKTREEAYADGDWLGTFNLWIVRDDPVPAILYQQRSLESDWAPGKLAVAVGGHYMAGEGIGGGLREVQEELGRRYAPNKLTYLGRRIYVGYDSKKNNKRNVVDIFMIKDNSPINNFHPNPKEVYSICLCPIKNLISLYSSDDYAFATESYPSRGGKKTIRINKNSFPYNWDNYHKKMVYLSDRFLRGDGDLFY